MIEMNKNAGDKNATFQIWFFVEEYKFKIDSG